MILLKRIIIYCFVLTSLLCCKSHSEIKKLSSQINCNNTVHFVWDNDGNLAKTEKRGMHKDSYATFFKGKKLDYKQIFIESVEELNGNYIGKYIYKENHGFPSDSIIQVTVKLEKIIWNMGFSKLVKDTQLSYSISNKDIELLTSSSVRGGKGLKECFENANLQFIMAMCDN